MQVDPSGHIPIANYITKIQFTKLIGGFDSFWWGRVNYSVTKLIEQYPEEIGIFYAHTTYENGDFTGIVDKLAGMELLQGIR